MIDREREKVIQWLVQECDHVDSCTRQCTPADGDNCWGRVANTLVPLFETDCQQRIAEIFREIEKHYDNTEGYAPAYLILESDFEKFKAKYVKGGG